MPKKTASRNSTALKKNTKTQRESISRVIKGTVLLLTAVLALWAGIYKGGEGLFFGVVFAMVCGLLGILYMKGDSAPTNVRKR